MYLGYPSDMFKGAPEAVLARALKKVQPPVVVRFEPAVKHSIEKPIPILSH